jgi:putative ABC transport system permease protein
MSVIWHKVWADLWSHKTRTLLAIFSIAVGVFAVGAIFGLIDQLLSGMDAAHRAVAPSHFNIFLRGTVDEATVDNLEDTFGVAAIDPVNQISLRYKHAGEADWSQGNLVVRPDYTAQTYDVLTLTGGVWPRDPDLGLERLTAQYFGFNLGDTVTLDVDGTEKTYTLSGLVRHPFVQPPAFGGVAHFFADSETLADFGIPEGRYGQLLVRITEPYSREKAEEVAGELRSRLGRQGVGVAVTIYQDPNRHWGRIFVEGTLVVLQVMAAVSLFLSVVLVLNTLTALITQQTDQIGVLKAIGGRGRDIVKVYLAGVLVYGLAALAVALPLGMVTAFYASQAFLGLFNIDYKIFQFSTRAVLLQAAAAVIAPLLAALIPVLRGAALSVREAIATYGLGGDFGATRFDRGVEAFGARFLPTAYAAALGNLFRRKARLALTVLVLTTAGVMFLVVMSLLSSVLLTIDNDGARRRYDVQIGFTVAQRVNQVTDVLRQNGVAESEMWLSRNATILRQGERLEDSAGLGVQLTGLPVPSDFYRPIITAGRWLAPGDARVVVISQDTAEKNRLAVGDTVTLDLGDVGGETWEIIGTYQVIFGGGFTTESFFAPLPAVEAATRRTGEGTLALIRLDAPTEAQAVAASDRLREALEDDGRKVDLYTSTVKLAERTYTLNQFGAVLYTLLGLASLMASVGMIGLTSALSLSVMERTREIGVLRAIGARSPTIALLFIMEGVLQSLVSWLLAAPLAFGLAQPLARQLGQTMLDVNLDYAFNWPALAIWLGVTILIGVFAALGPARSAARLSVRESLAYS